VQELGRGTAGQTAKLAMEIFHTVDAVLGLGRGLAGGQGSIFLISLSSNPLLSRGLNFVGDQSFFRSSAKFTKIHKFGILWSLLGD